MITNAIQDFIISISYHMFGGMLVILYYMAEAVSSVISILFIIFSSDVYFMLYSTIATSVGVVYVISIIYNIILKLVNDTEEVRFKRKMIKSIFGLFVLIIVPTILKWVLLGFEFISDLLFQITGAEDFGTLVLTTILSMTSQPTEETLSTAQMVENLVNNNFYIDATLRVDKVLQYPINWLWAGVLSLIFFILMFLIVKKIGSKVLETFEVAVFLPVSTLSFTKEGGTLFTRSFFGIIGGFVSILLVEFSFTLASALSTKVNEMYGSVISFIVILIFVLYLIKNNSKLASLLETDGNNFELGVGDSAKRSVSNSIVSAIGGGVSTIPTAIGGGASSIGSSIYNTGSNIKNTTGNVAKNLSNLSMGGNSNDMFGQGVSNQMALTSGTHNQGLLSSTNSGLMLPGSTSLQTSLSSTQNGIANTTGVMLQGYNNIFGQGVSSSLIDNSYNDNSQFDQGLYKKESYNSNISSINDLGNKSSGVDF